MHTRPPRPASPPTHLLAHATVGLVLDETLVDPPFTRPHLLTELLSVLSAGEEQWAVKMEVV